MTHVPAWLINSFIYLAAAVVVVPLAKKLGLGSIIGYLGAGIAIGPWGLGLVLVGPWLGHASWHAYRGSVRWQESAVAESGDSDTNEAH